MCVYIYIYVYTFEALPLRGRPQQHGDDRLLQGIRFENPQSFEVFISYNADYSIDPEPGEGGSSTERAVAPGRTLMFVPGPCYIKRSFQ